MPIHLEYGYCMNTSSKAPYDYYPSSSPQPIYSYLICPHWLNIIHLGKYGSRSCHTQTKYFSLAFAVPCSCRYNLIFLYFRLFFSLVFYRLFFIDCFLENFKINEVLSGSKLSFMIGSSQPSSSHTLKILGTPLPACSPISIMLNIFIKLLFLGSDFPPRRICSFPGLIYPGFSNVSSTNQTIFPSPLLKYDAFLFAKPIETTSPAAPYPHTPAGKQLPQ